MTHIARSAFHLSAILAGLLLAGCFGNDSDPAPPPASPPIAPPTLPTLPAPPPANQTCIAPPRSPASIALIRAYPNLQFVLPVAMLQPPGDSSRWFVVEKDGRIYWFASNDATATRTLFINLTDAVDSQVDGGVLGMAFHPNFSGNGYVYLHYTTSDDPVADTGVNFRSRVSRFTASADRNTLLPGSEVNLITLARPDAEFHIGGHLAFGPDGFLYIGFGDGGPQGDPLGKGQNTNTLHGKMLRIDVNNGSPYAIPSNNPFAGGVGGLPEIYAWGFRNPWRWSFDRLTGELWLGDVGYNNWEEVDKVVRGGNYGWNIREGAHCFSPSVNCPTTGLIDPVVEYDHSDGNCSITGGYVYRGNAVPNLRGLYVYGDFCTGQIWGVPASGGAPQPLASSGASIVTFAEGNDGELLVNDLVNGVFYRIAEGAGGSSTIPQRLSESGCVDAANPAQAAAGVIGYDINAPLWSDGASKTRFLALPPGKTIDVAADNDWIFPTGTVLMKHFLLAGRYVETRLFMRHPDGEWGGYSYEWNGAQTDATYVANAKNVLVGSQSWHFPSGGECLRCHTSAAGRALGPETSQMNRVFNYPPTTPANQLAAYEHFGLFSAPVGDPATLPRLTAPDDTAATLDQRARAYLHSNCSICHRPGGPTAVTMDLRNDTALAAANICNVSPQDGDLGVTGARLLVPGDPGRSVIPLRMRALDSNRMPPLATSVVDTEGATLIENWISSISACP